MRCGPAPHSGSIGFRGKVHKEHDDELDLQTASAAVQRFGKGRENTETLAVESRAEEVRTAMISHHLWGRMPDFPAEAATGDAARRRLAINDVCSRGRH